MEVLRSANSVSWKPSDLVSTVTPTRVAHFLGSNPVLVGSIFSVRAEKVTWHKGSNHSCWLCYRQRQRHRIMNPKNTRPIQLLVPQEIQEWITEERIICRHICHKTGVTSSRRYAGVSLVQSWVQGTSQSDTKRNVQKEDGSSIIKEKKNKKRIKSSEGDSQHTTQK